MYLIKRATMFAAMFASLFSISTESAVYASSDLPDPTIHVVETGDNLGQLSERYGISIGALALANGLSSSIIHVGQDLLVPGSDWPVNPKSDGRDPQQQITYVVRSGDYLGRVASEYGTTVEAIMNASNLTSPLIITDQFLTIPAISDFDSADMNATLVDVMADETVNDITDMVDEVNEASLTDALVEVIAPEIVDDSVEVTEDVTGIETRMRDELHDAHYPYAFTASSDEIIRVYSNTVRDAASTPADVVVSYWSHVSNKRYETAWEMLTDGFQERAHDNDFEEYSKSYRDMALCSAKAGNVDIASRNNTQTIVNSDVTYRTGADCTSLDFNMIITLVALPESGEWEIDKVAVNPYGEIQVTETDAGKNESKWIDVDIGAQRVYAMVGDRREREFLASTGIERYPTVTGQFQIWVKLRKDDMRGVDLGVPWHLPDVPYVMYFFSDYGIHGTYWHDNFGTPMSHGCINLSIADAEWLYNFSSVGTVVNIHH